MKPAIICDLDGTIALLHGRNPYDATSCEQDALNEPIARIITRFAADHEIIFCSGREDKYREQSERWLQAKLGSRIPNFKYKLFMRPTNNFEKDAIIKQRIYETQIKLDYRIIFVLDDRKQVKRMWVKNNLFVLDCNQQDTEF